MPSCVDASCVLRLWLPGSGREDARERWAAWHREGEVLVAPGLITSEVTNGVFQQHRHGRLGAVAARALLATFERLRVELDHTPELSTRAFELAREHGLSATYDAHYLATCERHLAGLWTADRRLHRAAQAMGLSSRLMGS